MVQQGFYPIGNYRVPVAVGSFGSFRSFESAAAVHLRLRDPSFGCSHHPDMKGPMRPSSVQRTDRRDPDGSGPAAFLRLRSFASFDRTGRFRSAQELVGLPCRGLQLHFGPFQRVARGRSWGRHEFVEYHDISWNLVDVLAGTFGKVIDVWGWGRSVWGKGINVL